MSAENVRLHLAAGGSSLPTGFLEQRARTTEGAVGRRCHAFASRLRGAQVKEIGETLKSPPMIAVLNRNMLWARAYDRLGGRHDSLPVLS